ncbi:uncharacterized protein LOC123301534 [Chrysoperla carnea]|uniref:uncharacterized protein LOC123301534 n=1 Tax=Chrysoperla carnea TaxID=189513 RepID=UPI001D06C69C|nr:uncharacterized protein LOC123301534 [Chrysoperla carnea]
MCEPITRDFYLDPNITREEISKRLCGDEECPGMKLFKEIGIEPLAKQAKQILESVPCCGGVKKCPQIMTQYNYGLPCRGPRRCEVSRVTTLPDLPEPDINVGTFCGIVDCPMGYLMSPGSCRKGKPCLSPECPFGTKNVQTQSPVKIPCGSPECPYMEAEEEYPILPNLNKAVTTGTQCSIPTCNRITVCKRRNLHTKNTDNASDL